MIIKLRKGKPKQILENSRNSALNAVEIYNKPNTRFRLESYIVLMIIAWTNLFHAYFQSRGVKYYYKGRDGKYLMVADEKKTWELNECIKQYSIQYNNQCDDQYKVLSEPVKANLDFFIKIRNKIEHNHTCDLSQVDIKLFGQCQSLLYNYENLLIDLFGEEYSLNTCLAYSLQFSQFRTPEQKTSQRKLLSKEISNIVTYIDKYNSELSQEIYDSPEYSIKVLLIPKISNNDRGEAAIEFVNWNSVNPDDRENYEKVRGIIKEKIEKVPVSNANMLKPTNVIDEVEKLTNVKLKVYDNTLLWHMFNIRPPNDSDINVKMKTNKKYCVYDEPHKDYVYTLDWVKFVSSLILNYRFTIEKIRDMKEERLNIDDFPLPQPDSE